MRMSSCVDDPLVHPEYASVNKALERRLQRRAGVKSVAKKIERFAYACRRRCPVVRHGDAVSADDGGREMRNVGGFSAGWARAASSGIHGRLREVAY